MNKKFLKEDAPMVCAKCGKTGPFAFAALNDLCVPCFEEWREVRECIYHEWIGGEFLQPGRNKITPLNREAK